MSALPDADSVALGRVSDLAQLLRAIADIARDSHYIYLEDPASKEVVTFLEKRKETPAPLEIERGTLWPRPRVFHLRASHDNICELIAFADRMADVEVAEHLVLYDAKTILLEAYDVGDAYVRVHRSLPPESIARLREVVND